MLVEILVFRRDERLLDQVRYRVGRREQAALLGEFVNQTALTGVNPADRWWRIGRKGFVAGQIAPVHPENRTNSEGNHAYRHGQGGKNTPEERQDHPKHAATLLEWRLYCPVYTRKGTDRQKAYRLF